MLPLMLDGHNGRLLCSRLSMYFNVFCILTKNLFCFVCLLMLTAFSINSLNMKRIHLKKMFIDLCQHSYTLLFIFSPHLSQSSQSMYAPRLRSECLTRCTFTFRQGLVLSSLLVETVQEKIQKRSIGFQFILGIRLSGNISFGSLTIFDGLKLPAEVKRLWLEVDQMTTLFTAFILIKTGKGTIYLPFVDADLATGWTSLLFLIFIKQISLQSILSGYAMQ